MGMSLVGVYPIDVAYRKCSWRYDLGHLRITMASRSRFSIVTMPTHYQDDALLQRSVDKYKELRLQSLKSDPESFSSTFADESRQPVNFWTDRMLRPGARHLLAVELSNYSSAPSVIDEPQTVLESEWVGMLVLLGPNSIASNDSPPGKTFRGPLVEENTDENRETVTSAYHMAGFYVAPEHRGHGIGGALVQTAMEVIANDCEKMPNPKAICTVGVSHTNIVVRRLFKRMGFEEVGEDQVDTIDGRHLTEITLRRDLVQ
jgi:ribosomal protein S18 acetylase RimI-like enzyme